MNTEKKNTEVTKEDMVFLEKELKKIPHPIHLMEMAKKLAYQKNTSQLSHEVKKYDPYCIYEIGDSVYKEYDEPLTVNSKGVEHFKGSVVLKVINMVTYENFNCEMLEVDYAGGGIFRKYVDYMKKTKTQVLLPSNLEGKAKIPEKMKKEEDPRLSEMPMTDRDLKKLGKNLKTALTKSPDFFSWNDYWQLAQNQVEIGNDKINEIENHLLETQRSAETSSLVSKFFDLEPSDSSFEIHCLSLNHILEKKHKKNFVFVSPVRWGKWHLKKVLDSFLIDLPLTAPEAKLPDIEEEEKPEKAPLQTSSLKIYLTWREILSGGIKIPVSLNKELSSCREYIFTDPEERKKYTIYYYPSHNFFLGLKDFYEQNNTPQGASITLEKKDINQFHFWLKKSKKKITIFKASYDPGEDKILDVGEDLFTFSMPNKIIHLEKETFTRLLSLYASRNDRDLKELLILIFKNFGLEADNFSLHYLRAYHLVDVLKRTSLEDVEYILINSPEFAKSEKKKGVFSYAEVRIEEEAEPAAQPEVPIEAPLETPGLEEAPSAEAALPEVLSEEAPLKETPPALEEIEKEEVIPEKRKEEEIGLKPPPKKERPKPHKRRKPKIEVERAPRLRKGEKRIIEEKIEIEELEQEALTALKEKKEIEEREEIPKKKEEKIAKPVVTEEPTFGLFAEKLKSALGKKKPVKKKK